MKLEDQVITLEQAKRLKELGVEGKPLFYHEHIWQVSWRITQLPDGSFPVFPAFTVAELGVMLPPKDGWYSVMTGHIEGWVCTNVFSEDYIQEHGFASEAQARAAMLIDLLENKLITAEQVNSRL